MASLAVRHRACMVWAVDDDNVAPYDAMARGFYLLARPARQGYTAAFLQSDLCAPFLKRDLGQRRI